MRLIDADAIPYITLLKQTIAYKIDIDKMPTADRPQGEWNPYYTKRENNDIFNCKLCGTTFIVMQGKDNMNFCPNCGARMRPGLQGKHFDSIIIDESWKGVDDDIR